MIYYHLVQQINYPAMSYEEIEIFILNSLKIDMLTYKSCAIDKFPIKAIGNGRKARYRE